MSRASLVITKQGLSQAEAARTYGLFEATVSRLMARYRAEGKAAFEPHYRLATGTEVEITSWLDDCTRYALHISAHPGLCGTRRGTKDPYRQRLAAPMLKP